MELLPTMHVHSAIGLQLLALPSTFILCFTSMLRERSIGEQDEKRLVRLYKQHAFILELVQLFVTLMAFGFATGNTVAAFEARSLVIDHASEEVTRMIVKSALVRNAWLLGSAACILACVNMLDSWSLPESLEDLTDPLFRLTRTLIAACKCIDLISPDVSLILSHADVRPRSTIDESQFFFCVEDTFTEDLERSTHSKKSSITHSLANLPAKKRTSESSDSDETITQPQVAIKTGMDYTPRPTTRNPFRPVPTRALDSFPRLHAVTQNPSTGPPPAKKVKPHYQDQTMASSIRSLASSTSFSSFGSSTSFASLPSLASSTSNSSSTTFAKPTQQASQKHYISRKPALSRNSSNRSLKSPSTSGKNLTSTPKKARANTTEKATHRTAGRKRSVTFDLNPAVFPDSGLSGSGSGSNSAFLPDDDERGEKQRDGNEDDDDEGAAAKKNDVQIGLVRVRVREIELGESASGEIGLERQQQREEPVAMNGEDRGGFGSDDGDDDENEDGGEWEEEGESNGFQEEEEALVRKQRPNVVRRDSGSSEV
jgi:hypothetical protein